MNTEFRVVFGLRNLHFHHELISWEHFNLVFKGLEHGRLIRFSTFKQIFNDQTVSCDSLPAHSNRSKIMVTLCAYDLPSTTRSIIYCAKMCKADSPIIFGPELEMHRFHYTHNA